MLEDKRDLLIWAAGFFDGEGCVAISKVVDKRAPLNGRVLEYERYQMSTAIIQIIELALRFESYLEETVPLPTVYRDEQSLAVLRVYFEQARVLNARNKLKDYTEEELIDSAEFISKGEPTEVKSIH